MHLALQPFHLGIEIDAFVSVLELDVLAGHKRLTFRFDFFQQVFLCRERFAHRRNSFSRISRHSQSYPSIPDLPSGKIPVGNSVP